MSLKNKNDLKNKISSNIIMPKKVEINSHTKLNTLKTTLYSMIRTSKKIDGRSFQKYINQVAAIKNKEENRQKLMHLYDTIQAINKGETTSTYKKVAEVAKEKKAKKTEAAARIQRLFKKVLGSKKYFLIDVLLYRKPDDSDKKRTKQKIVRKYGESFIQYAKVQLSVKAPKQFPLDLVNRFIARDHQNIEFKRGLDIFLTNDDFKSQGAEQLIYLNAFLILKVTTTDDYTYKEYDPIEEDLQDTAKISMYHKYINTKFDLEFDTFEEAIKNNNYVEKECCINTLYDYYKDSLLNPDKKQQSYLITRDMILKTLGKTEENIKDGIKLPELKMFFEKYNLQLRVINEFGKVIYKYDPEKRNRHHKAMYCMVKGNHIYTLNCDIKSLEQNQDKEAVVVRASSECITYEDATPNQCKMISNINDIIKIAQDFESEEKSIVNLIHQNDDLVEIFYELKNVGYEPKTTYECGRLTRLIVKVNSIVFIIRTQQLITSSIDGEVCVSSEDVYNNMESAMVSFKKQLFKKEHKSYLTELDIILLNEYRTVANYGILKTINTCDLVEIDVSKAYTSSFVEINEVPIFNEFDNFKKYRNEKILDYNLYIIKTNELNLFCNKQFNLCYGKFLSGLTNYQILGFKQPSFIKKVNYKDIIDQLWDTDISSIPEEDIKIKKLIANVNFGMLEKSKNTAVKSFVYDTLGEAKKYQQQHGGEINIITKYNSEAYEEEDDVGDMCTNFRHTQVGKEYYVLNVKDTAFLKDGFRYIKELLLQTFHYKLNNDYNTLINNGIDVFSVKTDAFTIRECNIDKAKSLISFDNKIGNWRVSKTDDYKLPFNDFKIVINKEIQITEPTAERVEIKNEWDTKEICNVFEDKKRVMVRAEYAGCGKSYAASYMEKLGHKVLFVCPTNKLAINNKGITINKLFGFGMTNDINMSKFDDSAYDVVVFDEIYFYSIGMLQKIKRYCDNNINKIILATGDMNQLEPIECIGNNIDADYLDTCINMIFPHEIYLKENKRLKTEEDKVILKQFKNDIFNTKLSEINIIKKYFQMTDKITTESNIAYTNKRCSSVAKQVRINLNKKDDYEVGEKLVCRKFFKMKDIRFNVNYEYEIVKCYEKSICIKDNNTKEEFNVLRKLIENNFIFSYCGTCHSLQGSSIDKEITIFEWNFKHVSRNWLYTAVTRATHLKNVKFFINNSSENNDDIINQYFEHKIEGYVKQDDTADRIIENNYVNVEWLSKCIGQKCGRCHAGLHCEVENEKIKSNITAQRVDNSLCHSISNIIPYCVYCNVSQSNR